MTAPVKSPTIFPDAPKYVSKTSPKKSKQRNICDQVIPAAKQSRAAGLEQTGQSEAPIGDFEAPSEDDRAVQSENTPYGRLIVLPSWSKISLPDCKNEFHYAERESDTTGDDIKLALRKHVKINVSTSHPITGSQAVDEVFLKKKKVASARAIRAGRCGGHKLCAGTEVHPLHCPSFNETFFSTKMHSVCHGRC